MKKFWDCVLQKVIITILTLGMNLILKGKKVHEKKKEELEKELNKEKETEE